MKVKRADELKTISPRRNSGSVTRTMDGGMSANIICGSGDPCGNPAIPATVSALIGGAACLWGAAVLAVSQTPLTIRAPGAHAHARRLPAAGAAAPRDHVFECHSQDRRKGGLSLATYGDVLEGGRSGAVVRPGNSAGSLLVHRSRARPSRRCPRTRSLSTRRRSRSSVCGSIRALAPRRRRRRPLRRGRRRWRSIGRRLRRFAGARWTSTIDRFVAAYLGERRAIGTGGGVRCGLRPARLPRRLGSAPDPRRAERVSGRSLAFQTRRARRAAAGGQPEVRRSLDLVLERPAAQ